MPPRWLDAGGGRSNGLLFLLFSSCVRLHGTRQAVLERLPRGGFVHEPALVVPFAEHTNMGPCRPRVSLQPGGLSPASVRARRAVSDAAGEPCARIGPCEAGAHQAPGSARAASKGMLSSLGFARMLSTRTEFVLIHTHNTVSDLYQSPDGNDRPSLQGDRVARLAILRRPVILPP